MVNTLGKRDLTNFWKTHWSTKKITPVEWLEELYPNTTRFSNIHHQNNIRFALVNAVEKMKLEKLITEETKIRLQSMLSSSDQDDVYLAIVTISKIKPTKFKQPKDES